VEIIREIAWNVSTRRQGDGSEQLERPIFRRFVPGIENRHDSKERTRNRVVKAARCQQELVVADKGGE